MVLDIATLDEKIERLREGDTLTENEVKALCEKVRLAAHRLLKRPRVI
jgi:serine/threonine-protein phosphatase 2A catalytic subunit